MVHKGIEYGIMASYKRQRSADEENAPLRHPEHDTYHLNLPDIAEVWRRGSAALRYEFGGHEEKAAARKATA